MTEIKMNDNGEFTIVSDGVEVGCGYMMLPESEDDFAYLERLDVHEGHRGKGHGTAALHELKKTFEEFYLTPDNEGAQRLYEKVGREISKSDYGRFGFAIDCGFGVYII